MEKIIKAIKSAKKYNPDKEIRLYYVGGCVRDKILGIESKDIDILVTNVAFVELCSVISFISEHMVSTSVGDNFQVIKARIDGEEYDFSIPRTEIGDGSGTHTGVDVFCNPDLDVESDLARRDFTMNAIAVCVETSEMIDPFGGAIDIHDKIINAVGNANARFSEDPLRILRAIQFAVRFDFEICQDTLNAMKIYSSFLKKISGERITEEFRKAFEKNPKNDNYKFLTLIGKIDYLSHIFGFTFHPELSFNLSDKFKFEMNMVLLFGNGGDFSVLKLDTTTITLIETFRNFKLNNFCAAYKNEKVAPYLLHLEISMPVRFYGIQKMLYMLNSIPLHPKYFHISTEYIMEKGITGKELGEIHKNMFVDMFYGHLKNTEEELGRWLEMYLNKCNIGETKMP